MSTPNMNLTLPTVSTTVGPTWATMLNTAFTQVDAHTHVVGAGQGVPISAAALAIDGDVSWSNHSLLSVGSVQLADQGTTLGANRVYNNGGNLYFTDGNGVAIPITASGGVAGTPGSIAGLASPGGASWSAITGFVWTSAALTGAIMDCGPILLRTGTASSNAVTLTPASATTAYTLTLPNAVPAANSFLTITTGGTLGYLPLATNYQLLATSIASTTSTTYSLLLGTVTLTTTGNPVVIGITADATGSDGYIWLSGTSTGKMKAWLRAEVDGSVNVGTQVIEIDKPSSGLLSFPLSIYSAFYPVAAGTHTFKLYGKVEAAGGVYTTTTLAIQNGKFFVYEL